MKLTLLLLAVAFGAHATPALVAGQVNTCNRVPGGGVTLACSLPSNPTAGNDIIATFSFGGTGSFSAISNTADTPVGSCDTATRIICTYVFHNIIGGAGSKTVTVTSTANQYISLGVVEYTGLPAILAINSFSSGSANSTSPIPCGTVTAATGEYIVAAMVAGAIATNITASSGFTIRNGGTSLCGGTPQCYAMEDQVVSSGGSFSPQFTSSAPGTSQGCHTTVFGAGVASTSIRHRVSQ